MRCKVVRGGAGPQVVMDAMLASTAMRHHAVLLALMWG